MCCLGASRAGWRQEGLTWQLVNLIPLISQSQVKLVAATDRALGPLKFILANGKPGKLHDSDAIELVHPWTNVFTQVIHRHGWPRPWWHLSNAVWIWISMYSALWWKLSIHFITLSSQEITSTLRYSRLRRNSKMMAERAARPFWHTLEALLRRANCQDTLLESQLVIDCRTLPLLAVLENVYGVLDVKDKANDETIGLIVHRKFYWTSNSPQMWEEMKAVRKKYLIAFIKGDCAHLGDPVHRRRIYIILVRRPVKPFFWIVCMIQILGRDVALKTLADHDDLETHCMNTYKKLTENQALGISVPLVSLYA